jgi:hypothetical protein
MSDRSEYNRRYYEANKERRKQVSRAWAIANPEARRAQQMRSYERNAGMVLVARARRRAEEKGVAFTITKHDIELVTHCPVFGIELDYSAGTKGGVRKDNSPSLDRIVPEKGYVPGNVRVISTRANEVKCRATVEDLEMLLAYMKGAA